MSTVGKILHSRALIAALLIVAALVAFRVMLPHMLLGYVNQVLGEKEGYRGEVQDIDVHLWRGAYEIVGFSLEKTEGEVPVPFIDIARIELSLQWSEIIRGALVGDITLHRPEVNFVSGPSGQESQTDVPQSWLEVTEDLFPFSINELDAVDATIHYRDFSSDPEVNVSLHNVFLHAANLTNSRSVARDKFATIEAYNRPGEGDPEITVSAELDTFSKEPAFDLRFSITGLDLVRLNDFFKAYGNFDVEAGTLRLYSEASASGGSFKGYVRPMFEDLEILDLGDEEKSLLDQAWEALLGAATTVLENPPADRVATHIPIEGDFQEQDIGYWRALGSLLKNAFIQAIRPGFRGVEPAGE
jgi:hypothetical protein